jgi:hypothetical protein
LEFFLVKDRKKGRVCANAAFGKDGHFSMDAHPRPLNT